MFSKLCSLISSCTVIAYGILSFIFSRFVSYIENLELRR